MKYFLIILFISINQLAFGQDVKTLLPVTISEPMFSFPLLERVPKESSGFQFLSQVRSANYYTVHSIPTVNHLPGLFCKMEYKIETKSKLAPRFRLGSLNYANWMEGKGNYFARY